MGRSLAAFALVAVVVLLVVQLTPPPERLLVPDVAPDGVGDRPNPIGLVLKGLPASLYLAGFAAGLALLVGVPLGVVSAAYRGTVLSGIIRLIGVLTHSLPNFALLIVAIWIVVVLEVLPFRFPSVGGIIHLVGAGSVLALFHLGPVADTVRRVCLERWDRKPGPAALRPGMKGAWRELAEVARREPLRVLFLYFGTVGAVMLVGLVIVELALVWPGAARWAIAPVWNFHLGLVAAATMVLTFSLLFIAGRLAGDGLEKRLAGGFSSEAGRFLRGQGAETLAGLSIPVVDEKKMVSEGGRGGPWNKLAGGLAILFLALVLVVAALPNAIAPGDPKNQQLRLRHYGPLTTGMVVDRTANPPREERGFFLLGTDHLGRDVLSRTIFGLSRTIWLAAGSVVMAAVVGIGLGLAAGWLGGLGQWVVLVLADASRSIPAAGLIAFTAVSQAGWFTLVVAAVVVLWATYYRQVEGLRAVQRDNHEGMETAVGGNRWIWRAKAVGALAGAQIGFIVILQTGIEAVGQGLPGLGIASPSPGLGQMISGGRQYMVEASWEFLIPLLAVFVLALGFNLVGWWRRGRWIGEG